MLSKFSVRKPMTILVAVVMIIVLGCISFTRMTTDLLPSMDLPYVAVITACPGSGPERVETTVTRPLEQVLSTTNGIEAVTSVSSENSSMIVLQFAQGTNMDSAMIDLNTNIGMVSGSFEDTVAAPMMLRINPDLMPVMVASVDMDNTSLEELSRLLANELQPALERVNGVASVTAMGLLEKSLTITLDNDKIAALNNRILSAVDAELAESQQKLDDAQKELDEGRASFNSTRDQQTREMANASQAIASGRRQLEEGIAAVDQGVAQAQAQKTELESQLAQLQDALGQAQAAGIPPTEEQLAAAAQLQAGISACEQGIAEANQQKSALSAQLNQLDQQEAQLESGKMALSQELAKASLQLDQGEKELESAKAQLESAKEEAYKRAGLDGVITRDTISSLLAAENFSMPAGSVENEDGASFQVKVGDTFSSAEELENWQMFHIEAGDIGGVSLKDVAQVAFTDNSGDSYAKINGNDGILLTMQKQSTASTAEVSDDIIAAMGKLEGQYPGLHLTALSDQGQYIDIVTQSVLQNLIFGGILAVIILFLFLRDLKPTLLVAVSIPVSLLFAIVLMYFSGVTMNVISLAGLALGVGMLVDNSIVVIENIYRLRSEGVPAKTAAIEGGAKVAGAITASTLTTVCVFLPIVFTDGLSRQLFTDMGLTIAYSLVASLLIALTLVPALGASLMKKNSEKSHKLFDALVRGYRKALDFCLRRKWAVLVPVAVLLAVSVFGVTVMGTAFMPEMASSQLMVSLEMPVGTSREDTRAAAGILLDKLSGIEEIETIGAMQTSGGSGIMAMMGGSDREVSFYVLLKEGQVKSSDSIARTIEAYKEELGAETLSASGNGMGAMTAMLGSGISVSIFGDNLDTLQAIAKDVAAMLGEIEGVYEISDGMEDASEEIRIQVDKDAAMKNGLTVAQIYQAVSAALKTETNSTTLTEGAKDYPVVIAGSHDSALTAETLKDFTLKATSATGEEKEIPLSEVAEIVYAQSLPSIHRANQTRTMSVTASVDRDHNIGLAGRALQEKLDSYPVPEGFSIQIAGENENITQALGDLGIMVALAVAMIYLIMVAQFQSLKSPFIVMFTLPLAFTGGLLALWIFGFELSVISMLGFLILCGVVVNNGIVFVDYANQLREGGAEKRAALLDTGCARIRPILMTAMTTILGLSTLAFAVGEGADLLQPMAVVVIGGLLYATLLTLFVVPVLYDLFHRKDKAKE